MKIPEHVVNTIGEENMKNATFPFNVVCVCVLDAEYWMHGIPCYIVALNPSELCVCATTKF